MIAFFPKLYEDELAYSWFSRYHVHSGHPTFSTTAVDLYGNSQAVPSSEFLGSFSKEVERIIERYMPLSVFIEKHTMFPQYARFLPVDRRRTALEYIMTRDIRYNDAIYKRKGKNQMRYCPLCADEDRERYGETYWHRKAQISGIDICLKHRCRLEDSLVGLAVEGLRFKLIHAECVIPQKKKVDFSVSDLECQVAEYVLQVFDSPMNYENDVLIGRFLRSRLEGTKYTSLRGEQVFARLLHGELREFYKDILPATLTEWYHTQKIFCAQTFHCYDICLLAKFLGITVDELLNPSLPDFTLQQRFDAQLRLLRSQGMTQKAAAAVLGVTLDTVKSLEQKRWKKQDVE